VSGRIEAEKVKENGGRVAAFFDLDGTMMALPSLERRFFRMLQYRSEIPVKNYFLWLRDAVRLVPRGIGTLLKANKMYLRGIAADRWASGGLKPARAFFEDGLERMAWHARKGHTVVLMSGTLEPIAQDAARAMESRFAARGIFLAIRVCATRLEELDGHWTGRILGEAMFGEAKARAAKKMALEMKLDLASCYAYGDRADDRWLLAAVGRPFAVNPSKGLVRLARMLGWSLLDWEEEKLTQRRPDRASVCSGERREIEKKRKPPRVIT
jgi:HAD superfamily phosphoserine phosphatase-like hydrolase